MGITLDAKTPSLCTGFGSGHLTLGNFTCAADASDLYVCIIYSATNTTGLGSSFVKYNGVSLSQLLSTITTNQWIYELWRLKNPASGSHAVTADYTGTFQHVAVGAWSFKNEDPTTPEKSTNVASESLSGGDDTFPDISVPVTRGDYGFLCGGITYDSSFDGPPAVNHPFLTTGFNNGNFVGSSGLASPGQTFFMFYGPPDGASDDASLTANQSDTYNFTLGIVSLNALPDRVPDRYVSGPPIDNGTLAQTGDYR